MEEIKWIKTVEINNLWGKYNIFWKLYKDVNILTGYNGSGKTTILNLIKSVVHSKCKKTVDIVDDVKITFNNNETITYSKSEPNHKLNVDAISTFNRFQGDDFATESGIYFLKVKPQDLDLQTIILANKYKDLVLSSIKKNQFLDIIDNFFKVTGKKADRNATELRFKLDQQEFTAHRLSTGEKQLLVILLTVLLQENKPAVLLIDDPETSMHSDWQEELIATIIDLNNNVQIIMATHSIILTDWADRVFETQDIFIK